MMRPLRYLGGFLAVLGCARADPAQIATGSGGFIAVGNGPLGSGAPPPALLSMAGLHIVGNQIRNEDDQVVQLRGVNRDSGEYMCLNAGTTVFRGPTNQASVDAKKAWGINVVRLPFNESCALGINGAPFGGSAYRAAYKAYVDLLTANNIAVIAVLQWSGGPSGRLAGPYPEFNNALLPMPGVDAPAAWSVMSDLLKDNDSVIFDLYNEPLPHNSFDDAAAWTCLRDGGACAETRVEGTPYTATGMQALVNTIRATGATNIIMVPGVQFTNSLTRWLEFKPSDPLAVDQLMASWHSYANQICASQACIDNYIAPVAAQVPVIADEIGQGDCQNTYISPLMDSLDAIGVSYAGWAWNDYDCSYPALITSYDGTPTAYGAFIRAHFQERAGLTPDPPPVIPFFNDGVFPYGINVGSASNFTAGDGTVYYADVATDGLAIGNQFFSPFTNGNAIAGTTDDGLYQTGAFGAFGSHTINVPNGSYHVTIGVAPSASHGTGEFGQDVYTSSNTVIAGCKFSMTPLTCPGSGTAPSVNTAYTFSYDVSIFNQQLFIQVGASFGDGRQTILNSIKVEQNP